MIGNAEITPMEDLSQDHYSQTVSIMLQLKSSHSAKSSSFFSYSPNSAFGSWKLKSNLHHSPSDGPSQWLLKYILFTVPSLHSKHNVTNNNLTHEKGSSGGIPSDELSANHLLAERRRREKLNERFIILRSLVPFVIKMDKASILGDTIDYVKELHKKIDKFEGHNKPGAERQKRKTRLVEKCSSGITEKVLEAGFNVMPQQGNMLEVSIIESDALVELNCPYKEGLLLDVLIILRDMCLEVTIVQSCFNNGYLVAELRAKVKDNANGKKPSITEVKRAVNQIMP